MLKYNNLYQDSGGIPLVTNRVRELRENRMVGISELARKARISELTVVRIERGERCGKDTKRKILAALDLLPLDMSKVFHEN
jgi:DNA-binding XRE family transcriptional regulator